MEIFKYILLGLVQGVTEFLPISSSGHLVLVKYFVDLPQDITLDVTLHFATFIAVFFYYRKRIFTLIKSIIGDVLIRKIFIFSKLSDDSKYCLYILIGILPAGFAGYFFEEYFDGLRSPLLVSVMFILIALYMLFAQYIYNKNTRNSDLNVAKSILIGLSQVLALIPGTSRSGVTISTGMLFNLKKEESADFSFLLSLPLILGAFIFKITDIENISNVFNINVIIAFASALVSGYLSIIFLLKIINKFGLIPFIIYRIVAGVILLILFTLY